MFAREMRIEGSASTMLIPLVLPEAILRVLSVDIGPKTDESRSDSFHPIWIESPCTVAEKGAQRSFSRRGWPACFVSAGLCFLCWHIKDFGHYQMPWTVQVCRSGKSQVWPAPSFQMRQVEIGHWTVKTRASQSLDSSSESNFWMSIILFKKRSM